MMILALALAGGLAVAAAPAEPTLQAVSVEEARREGFAPGVLRLDYASGRDRARDWALVLPPPAGDTWVIVLHGHGSTGDQLYTRADIRRDWLPALQKRGLGILTPNFRGNSWMSPAACADLHALLGLVRERYRARRFIITGGSMGGTSALIYACRYPEDVCGVVALCPATDLISYHAWCRERNAGVLKEIADAMERGYGGAPAAQPETYREHSAQANAGRLPMPTFVCHGTADTIIPVSQTRALAARMGDTPSFAYVEVPGGGHDSPLPRFAEGLAWVLGEQATK